MLKNIKILLSLCLLFSVFTMSNNNIVALASDDEVSFEIESKESNYFESLLTKRNEITKTKSVNYNAELREIDQKIIEFKNFVDELNAYSDAELKQFGYTNDQINAIRKDNKTNEDYMRASFSVTTSGSIKSTYNASSNTTNYTVTANFSTNAYMGELYNNNNFAIASVPSINQPMQTSSTSSVKYRYYQGNTPYYTNGSCVTRNFNGASKFSFPVGKDVSGTRAYIYSGTFTSTSVVQGRAQMIDAMIGYGYASSSTSVQFGLSVGIEKTGSASATISVTPSSASSWTLLGERVIHGTTK